jgi:hypothetical protein
LFSGIQTICYSDEGYFGSAYQNFFDAHESTYTTDSYYLSILVGAIWDKLFGCYGIFSYTVLVGLVSCITFHFIQRTITKEYESSRWVITIGFFMTLLYGFTYLVNNNHLTCLILSVESCLIYEAYNEKSLYKYFVASFLGGLNVFIRLPNVLLLVLLIIPIFFVRKDKRLLFSYLKNGFLGVILSVAFVSILMNIFGHLEYFYKATFENLSVEAASGEESIHSFGSLATNYLKDYACILVLMLIVWTLLFLKKYFKSRIFLLVYLIIVFLIMIVITSYLKKYVYVHSFNYIIFSVALFCIIRNIILKRYNNLVLYLLSLGIAFIMPLGTDAGIASLGGLSSMFMFPLALSETKKEVDGLENRVRINNLLFIFSLLSLFILFRFFDIVRHGSWAEPGNRLQKVYTIDNSKYATVFVSKERDEEIDTALEELNKYVKEGDYLFCFKDIPIFNYLTNTKPYAYCSEPGFINPGLFKAHLDQAEKNIQVKPIVIKEKVLVRNPGWEKQGVIMEDFLRKNEYIKIWENNKFEILVPNNILSK